jgi:hypothetical protein
LKMEKFDMEENFHLGEMDDNKKWYDHMNQVKSTQWNSLLKWNWLHGWDHWWHKTICVT